MPESCRECQTMAGQGTWQPSEQCNPCFLISWEAQQLDLWRMVTIAHIYDDKHPPHYRIDWGAYHAARTAAHPAFSADDGTPLDTLRALLALRAELNSGTAKAANGLPPAQRARIATAKTTRHRRR